jgi:hypothetical protein
MVHPLGHPSSKKDGIMNARLAWLLIALVIFAGCRSGPEPAGALKPAGDYAPDFGHLAAYGAFEYMKYPDSPEEFIQKVQPANQVPAKPGQLFGMVYQVNCTTPGQGEVDGWIVANDRKVYHRPYRYICRPGENRTYVAHFVTAPEFCQGSQIYMSLSENCRTRKAQGLECRTYAEVTFDLIH